MGGVYSGSERKQKNDKALQLGAVALAMRPLCTFLQLRIVSWATMTPARPLM